MLPTLLGGESAYQRIENINFNWTSQSPMPGINSNGFLLFPKHSHSKKQKQKQKQKKSKIKWFSIRFLVVWEGGLVVPRTGSYNFSFTADDGIRFYLGDLLLLDAWVFQYATTYLVANITLDASINYLFRVEYFDQDGLAQIVAK